MNINGVRINVNFKKGAENALEKYHALNDELDKAAQAANRRFTNDYQSGLYTPLFVNDVYNDAMKKALADFSTEAISLNSKYKEELKADIDRIITAMSASDKPNDYAAQIGNALQFLQIEGKNLTDESASALLNAFQSDYETMKLFKRAVEQIKGEPVFDPDGSAVFPLTFGKLAEQEAFVNLLSDMLEQAGKLFTYEKVKADTNYINGTELYTPMDRYMQLIGEKNLLDFAESADTLAAGLYGANEGGGTNGE